MATSVVDELVALLGYDLEGEENLHRFNKSLDGVQKKAAAVGAALGKMAAVAGAAVATGLTALGFSVLNTAAQFEKYGATLETIEGTQEKAQAALDWITDFAKTTPYEVDELTRAFVKLRQYGMDPMNGSMTVLGDTAAGMGKSLDQVVEAMADATTFQFERLRELGVVASQAGDQVTFSWTENGKSMSKTIQKTSTEVTKFLNDVWGKKFGGAMIRQSKTWNGMMSNLADSWTDFQRRIGDAGFFDAVKNKLADLMDLVAQWQRDGTIDRIAENLSTIFIAAADFIGAAISRIGRHTAFLIENFERLEPWIKTIGIAFGVMVARAFPIATALGLVAIAIDDILTYMEGGESVIGNFIEWLQDLLGVSEDVAEAMTGLGAAVSAALATAFLIAPVRTIKAFAGLLTRGVTAAIATARMATFAAVVAWGPGIASRLAALAPWVARGVALAFGALSGPVGWAAIIGSVGLGLLAYFRDDLAAIDWGSLGETIGSALVSALKFQITLVPTLFKGAWNEILAIDWAGLGGRIIDILVGIMSAQIALIVGIFTGVASEIQSAVLEWFNVDLYAMGQKLMNSLWDGMKSIASQFGAWISGMIGTVKVGIQGAFSGGISTEDISTRLNNARANVQRTAAAEVGARIGAMATTNNNNQTVNVEAPVTVNVREATDAPDAVGRAVGGAIEMGAQPSRMQTGPAQ